MHPLRPRPTSTRRLALVVGAGAGAVSATVWTLGSTSGPLQTAVQAGMGLLIGGLVSTACMIAWGKALPRWAAHAVGMATCWTIATGTLLIISGDPLRSGALALPSLLLGLAITFPVLVTLEAGVAQDAAL
jgi:hypothetical protein